MVQKSTLPTERGDKSRPKKKDTASIPNAHPAKPVINIKRGKHSPLCVRNNLMQV